MFEVETYQLDGKWGYRALLRIGKHTLVIGTHEPHHDTAGAARAAGEADLAQYVANSLGVANLMGRQMAASMGPAEDADGVVSVEDQVPA